MIRIHPYEWLHLEVPGSGSLGRSKASGVLYITPRRVAIQGGDGPVWEAAIKDLAVTSSKKAVVLTTSDGRTVTWRSKKVPAAWWGNAILFWKRGIIQGVRAVDGAPPSFGNIAELPEALRNSRWNIRWYGADTLAEEGIEGDIPDTEHFRRVVHETNVILAALRHDGFPDGPPPAHYRLMLRRHALVHMTKMVWGWRAAENYITRIITGRGHMAGGDRMIPVFAGWPDRWHEPKPFSKEDRRWHHEINPASLGGHPYLMLERCRTMIPVVVRVADEIHENPGHNPYLRMRQLFEAALAGEPLPDAPREALELARAAADNPW